MKLPQEIPITIELIGIAVVSAGLALEVVFKANTFMIVITAGSLIVAGGGIIWGKFTKGKE